MEAQIKEKREKLSNLYHIACANGIVKNKGEFAALLGIARPTFSYALTGSNPTVNVDNMITKAEHALEAAGVDLSDIATSHIARRTFAANAFAATGSERIVSSMTGHSARSAAFERYTDVTDEMKRTALNLADKLPT